MASPLFSKIQTGEAYYDNVDCASYKGVTAKTALLLVIAVLVAALVSFYLPEILLNNSTGFYVLLSISSIVGFVSVIVGRFSERLSKYFSVLYAVCEGLFLGALTAIIEAFYPGVAIIAIFSTFIIFGIMLFLFGTGVIRIGSRFRTVLLAFTLGAIAITLFGFILNMFINFTSYIGIVIGLEAFLLIYGAITLTLHFAEAQHIVSRGASKDAEWSVALGLTVSLIYIYVEALRLIALLARRR